MLRHVELTEWMWWGAVAIGLVVLGLILSWITRTSPNQRARQLKNRDRWIRLINPLAGGSVWGSHRPSLALRVALLYFGVMALSIFNNPIIGLLLLMWSATLWVSVYLEKNRKKTTHQ